MCCFNCFVVLFDIKMSIISAFTRGEGTEVSLVILTSLQLHTQ